MTGGPECCLHTGGRSARGCIEEAYATRASQVFPGGAREPVTSQGGHVQRHLAHRLTRVEQERHPMLAGDAPDALSVIHPTCSSRSAAGTQ